MNPRGNALGCICRNVVLAVWMFAAAAGAHGDDDWRYVVEPGDTLIGISSRLLQTPGDWRALRQLNRIADPRRLRPGTELRIPLRWLRTDPSSATALTVVGEVEMISEGRPARLLLEGQTLQSADAIRSGAQSSALIGFVDGSRLLIAPDSQITLEALRVQRGAGGADTTLRLHEGHAESTVPPSPVRGGFEIRTPVVDLGVRGTEFRGHFDAATGTARSEVLDGVVAARAEQGAALPVAAGNGVVGRAGVPLAAHPLLPAPDLSMVAPLIERLPPRFEWPTVDGAVDWRAQVFDTGKGRRLLLDGRFDTALARWSDLADGAYLLRVRAIDARGLEGRDAEHRFRVKARPIPPFVRSPMLDARMYGPSMSLEWAHSSDAAQYRVQVATDESFAAPEFEREGLDATTIEVPLRSGRWYWRVGSIRADGDRGPWSDTQRFEQREIPPPPSLAPPQLDDKQIVLRGAAPRPGDRTQFQLARDDGFDELVVDGTTDTSEIRFDRPPSGSYRLRARSVDADGFAGPWSPATELDVPSEPPWWLLVPAALLLLLAL